MPANFPPSGTATRELSGMGTPDLLGTYGTFSFYTSDPDAFAGEELSGGVVHRVRVRDGRIRAYLEGPENPFLRRPQNVRAEFIAYPDRSNQFAKIVVGSEQRLLKVGEWSDWVPVEFSLVPTQTLPGEVRFFLKRVAPNFELYASPVNLDPLNPAMPVSTPPEYAAELAEATGRFYTQGMPEDTKGLRTGVLADTDFLTQAKLAGDENLAQFRYVLDRFQDGFLFYYFGNVDQVAHMMWRARDPQHPAYDAAVDGRNAAVVEELYRGLDAVVAQTLARLGPDDLLVVMSDHGFTSWRRAFHLNSWLRDNGYIALKDPGLEEDPGLFGNVDWSRTRAYAMGLNGLYVNLKGREKDGAVEPSEREALVRELSAKLLAVVDPVTGTPAITKMYRREEVYTMAGVEDIAPDLVVGYAKGTRGSDESALGGMPPSIPRRQHEPLERRSLHGPRGRARRPVVEPPAQAARAHAAATAGGAAERVRYRLVPATARGTLTRRPGARIWLATNVSKLGSESVRGAPSRCGPDSRSGRARRRREGRGRRRNAPARPEERANV